MIESLDTNIEGPDWNLETGEPSIVLFANAVQVWAVCQDSPRVTVDAAALAFNVKPELIRQAVEHHAWMFLCGQAIEHEGE